MAKFLDPQYQSTPLRFFLSVNRQELKWFALNVIFYGAGSLSLLAATYFLGRIIDAITLPSGENISSLLVWTVISVVCHELFYRLGHICEIRIISRSRRNVKSALFDHTSSLSFGYFADRFAGELAHKVSKTADALERMTLIMSNNFIEKVVLVLGAIYTLGAVHFYYGSFLTVWALVFIAGSLILAKEMDRRAGILAAEEAKTSGAIVDTYGNIGAVKVYGKKDNFNKTHRQIVIEADAFRRLGIWDIITFHYQGWSIIFLTLGIVFITGKLYSGNLVTAGEIVFVGTVALRLFNNAWDTGKSLADFIRYRGECAQNLRDLIVAPSIVDGDHASAETKEKIVIEYRDVTFGYVEERPVLDNFSITIKHGEKVGIVGLSGAGKTTFANLLLRFFDPQDGSIRFNNNDIRDFTQEFLRSHISYISQDTSLFHATIAENIAYGSIAVSGEKIKKAARLAYADDFINLLPKGYESVVGERGIKLSGGQRQRIAIARALLANRPLFLLDEATSALDSDSEGKIKKGLAALMEKKTVIAIAHRLSTLSHMDRIIFLENGKITEDGTHDELLKRNGKYAKLWHMQAGGFLPTALDE